MLNLIEIPNRKYFLGVIASSLVMLVGYLMIQTNSRPFYIYSTDIEPDYLMSILLVLDGEKPWSLHHPGTWIHYVSAGLLTIFNINPVTDTEYSLTILRTAAVVFNSVCILITAIIGLRSYEYKIFLFIFLSFIFPSSLYYLNYFGADSFSFGLAVLLTSIFFDSHKDNFSNTKSIIILSLVLGICLNTKIIFIPVFFIIFGFIFISDLLKKIKFIQFQSLKLLIVSVLLFLFLGFPVASLYPFYLLLRVSAEASIQSLLLSIFFVFFVFYVLAFLVSNYPTFQIFFRDHGYKLQLALAAFMWVAIFYKEVWANSYIATEKWRNLAPLHIFFMGCLLYYWSSLFCVRPKVNLLAGAGICAIAVSFAFVSYKNDRNQEFVQKSDMIQINRFVKKSIEEGYETYIWTGAGNSSHTYSPKNFWYWADYRYASSHYEGKNFSNDGSKVRFFNIRGERDFYLYQSKKSLSSEPQESEKSLKQNIKTFMLNMGMFREPPPINTYGLNAEKDKHRIIIRDVELELTFQHLPSISLEQLLNFRYGLMFKSYKVKLGSQEFIIFETSS